MAIAFSWRDYGINNRRSTITFEKEKFLVICTWNMAHLALQRGDHIIMSPEVDAMAIEPSAVFIRDENKLSDHTPLVMKVQLPLKK